MPKSKLKSPLDGDKLVTKPVKRSIEDYFGIGKKYLPRRVSQKERVALEQRAYGREL